MYSAYLISFLLLATALQVMGDEPAANSGAAAAAQTPATGGSNGALMDIVNNAVDSVKDVPVLGALANAAKAFPTAMVALAQQIANFFIGESGFIARFPGAAQFVAPLNDLALNILGAPQPAAPAQ